VLWIEREIVGTLIDPTLDDRARAAVEGYVDEMLRLMPEHLRLGVAGESMLFGAGPWLANRLGRFDRSTISRRIGQWQNSRIDVLRQYVRLLHGLVLFAEHELASDAA
jgi:hypothetical protein